MFIASATLTTRLVNRPRGDGGAVGQPLWPRGAGGSQACPDRRRAGWPGAASIAFQADEEGQSAPRSATRRARRWPSNTGCTSVGDSLITCSTSAVAVWRASASCVSLNRRVLNAMPIAAATRDEQAHGGGVEGILAVQADEADRALQLAAIIGTNTLDRLGSVPGPDAAAGGVSARRQLPAGAAWRRDLVARGELDRRNRDAPAALDGVGRGWIRLAAMPVDRDVVDPRRAQPLADDLDDGLEVELSATLAGCR